MALSLADRIGDGELAQRLLDEAPAMWLAQRGIESAMADLAILVPVPGPGELRVRIKPLSIEDQTWSLALVAPDRPGLLATTAAVCAAWGLDIRSASVASWVGLGIALQQVTLRAGVAIEDEPDWVAVGQALRHVLDGGRVALPAFVPGGPATVAIRASGPGRWRVSVSAPDRVGLLAAITGWLRDAGTEIEAAAAYQENGRIEDGFVVLGPGEFDKRADELAAVLS